MKSRLNWSEIIFMNQRSLLLLGFRCVAIRSSFSNAYHHLRRSQLPSTFLSFNEPTPGRFNASVFNFAPPWSGWFTIALRSLSLVIKDSLLKKSVFEKRSLCACIPSLQGKGRVSLPNNKPFSTNNKHQHCN